MSDVNNDSNVHALQLKMQHLDAILHDKVINDLESGDAITSCVDYSGFPEIFFDKNGRLKASQVHTMVENYMDVPFVYALASQQLKPHELGMFDYAKLLALGSKTLARAAFLAELETNAVSGDNSFTIEALVESFKLLFENYLRVVDVERTVAALIAINGLFVEHNLYFGPCCSDGAEITVYASAAKLALIEKVLGHREMASLRPPCMHIRHTCEVNIIYSLCENHFSMRFL